MRYVGGFSKFIFCVALMAVVSACSSQNSTGLTTSALTADESDPSQTKLRLAKSKTCSPPVGQAWVPQVPGATPEAHSASDAQVKREDHIKTLFPVGLAQKFSYATEDRQTVEFTFEVAQDLGHAGSVTLNAQVEAPPNALFMRGVWVQPVLVSLTREGVEYVNLSTACADEGFYSCSGEQCDANVACHPNQPSAFLGDQASVRRLQWDTRQGISNNAPSILTIPTCNWSEKNAAGENTCPFAQDSTGFGEGGRLKKGVYAARYALVANTQSKLTQLPELLTTMKLTVIKKYDPESKGATHGALDLNVILVGSTNVNDSRTERGKVNLNALFEHVYQHFYSNNTSTAAIRLGKISVFEWGCEEGGDEYAEISEESTDLLFKNGSSLLPEASEGKAINIFLVSRIPYAGSGTVLGKAGGIPGAVLFKTGSSGSVFSSFDLLASYNSKCSGQTECRVSNQDADFIEMGGTISHEMGHFLGLNHPSESDASLHDTVLDTPECDAGVSGYVTNESCLSRKSRAHPTTGIKCSTQCAQYSAYGQSYCPEVAECQFNHVMWWTTKNHGPDGSGDGNLFSAQSGAILNFSPLVR